MRTGQLYQVKRNQLFRMKWHGVESKELITIPQGQCVLYLSHEKERNGSDNQWMLVKVIYGDKIGWIHCHYVGRFNPSNFFKRAK